MDPRPRKGIHIEADLPAILFIASGVLLWKLVKNSQPK